MMKKTAVILLALFMGGCGEKRDTLINEPEVDMNKITQMAGEYASFRLETSLEGLSDREKAMLPLLFEAAAQMDAIFWKEAWGDRAELMRGVTHPDLIKMLNINYGPWERLGDNLPIVPGVGAKPAGAAFYPADMTREEFEAWEDPLKSSLYTLVRRTEEGDSRPCHTMRFLGRRLTVPPYCSGKRRNWPKIPDCNATWKPVPKPCSLMIIFRVTWPGWK